MSHIAQRALPMRPAAITVAAFHAGIIVILLSALAAPGKHKMEPVTQLIDPEPDRVLPKPPVEAPGPAVFERFVPPDSPPLIPTADESPPEITPTAIEPVGAGGGVGTAEPEWSRAEIVGSHEVPYPPPSIRNEEQGIVLLKVRIGADGRPREVQVDRSSGYANLDQAALRAVARWKFKPPMRGGFPVETWTRVPVSFQLTN